MNTNQLFSLIKIKFLLHSFVMLCCINTLNSQNNVVIEHIKKEQKINLFIEGELFTSYHYSDTLPKPILFPIISKKGAVITRGYPISPRANERIDHPHHTGCWFNFGDVNGLDFWNNSYAIPENKKDKYGKIIQDKIIKIESGKDTGLLEVEMSWVNNTGKAILKEHTIFKFSCSGSTRIIDRITTLTAVNSDVIFNDNKEGLLGLRVAREFESPADKPILLTGKNGKPLKGPIINNQGVNGYFMGSNGLEGKQVWGTQNTWVSLSAFAGGDSITIAVFDHPDNPGYPAFWHARDYGLFSINNFGQQGFNKSLEPREFHLPKDSSFTFKHRIIIKSGGFFTREQLEEERKCFENDCICQKLIYFF